MDKQDFFDWLDSIIDKGNADWELVESFETGHFLIRFSNICDDETGAENV